jgi:hypothetical protein
VALNDLEMMACDIHNVCLTAGDCREHVWMTVGPKFGSKAAGHNVSVRKALHGLKSSGAAFRAHLAETRDAMGHKTSYADADACVWLQLAVKADGCKHCECVLCHVDDALSMSHDPGKSMRRIQEDFKLKDNKIAEPDVCLGATSEKRTLENGKSCWPMLSEQHVKRVVTNDVEEDLARHGKMLPLKGATPSSSNHAPWLEDSPELEADCVQQLQELIGKLWWVAEIGRVDILLKTSLLLSHVAVPIVGHLEQACHVFGHLKMHPKRKLG